MLARSSASVTSSPDWPHYQLRTTASSGAITMPAISTRRSDPTIASDIRQSVLGIPAPHSFDLQANVLATDTQILGLRSLECIGRGVCQDPTPQPVVEGPR
jgi:hypothetical protein